jgi:hypothetical protein
VLWSWLCSCCVVVVSCCTCCFCVMPGRAAPLLCSSCCIMLYHLHELSEAGACRLTGMLKREQGCCICLCTIEQPLEPWMMMLASQRHPLN